eukprot:g9183.t1
MVSNPTSAGLCYDPKSGGGDGTWTIRASVKFFRDMVEGHDIDVLVGIITRSFANPAGGPEYCHLVALGPNGFVLCTCLRLLVEGLCCRHAFRAVVGMNFGFNSEGCMAPRWRDGEIPWTLAPLSAKRAVTSKTSAGLNVALPRARTDPGVFSHSKPTARASNWSSCLAFRKEVASLMTAIDSVAPCQRVLGNLLNRAKQLIGVEVASQHETSTGRISKESLPGLRPAPARRREMTPGPRRAAVASEEAAGEKRAGGDASWRDEFSKERGRGSGAPWWCRSGNAEHCLVRFCLPTGGWHRQWHRHWHRHYQWRRGRGRAGPSRFGGEHAKPWYGSFGRPGVRTGIAVGVDPTVTNGTPQMGGLGAPHFAP